MKDWPQGLKSWANPAIAAMLTVHNVIKGMRRRPPASC